MMMFLLSLDITLHFDVLIFMPHFLQACSSLSVAINLEMIDVMI